jgi:CHAD domain-containing protein
MHRNELMPFMREWEPPADLTHLIPKEINKLTNRQVLQRAAQLVQQKISEAGQDIKKKKLHDARKHLKVVQEVLRIMHFMDENKVSGKLVKQVKKVTSLIGSWHDYEVLASTLEAEHPSADREKEQKKLLKKIAKEQQQREKEIYREFDSQLNHEAFTRLQERVNPEVRIIQKEW